MKTFIAMYRCDECGVEVQGRRPDTPFHAYDYEPPKGWTSYVPPKPEPKPCPTCGAVQIQAPMTGFSLITTYHLPPELLRSYDETRYFCCAEHRASWLAKRETAVA